MSTLLLNLETCWSLRCNASAACSMFQPIRSHVLDHYRMSTAAICCIRVQTSSEQSQRTTLPVRLQHRHSAGDVLQGRLAAEASSLAHAYGRQLVCNETHANRGADSCQVRAAAVRRSQAELRSLAQI